MGGFFTPKIHFEEGSLIYFGNTKFTNALLLRSFIKLVSFAICTYSTLYTHSMPYTLHSTVKSTHNFKPWKVCFCTNCHSSARLYFTTIAKLNIINFVQCILYIVHGINAWYTLQYKHTVYSTL